MIFSNNSEVRMCDGRTLLTCWQKGGFAIIWLRKLRYAATNALMPQRMNIGMLSSLARAMSCTNQTHINTWHHHHLVSQQKNNQQLSKDKYGEKCWSVSDLLSVTCLYKLNDRSSSTSDWTKKKPIQRGHIGLWEVLISTFHKFWAIHRWMINPEKIICRSTDYENNQFSAREEEIED